MPAVDNKTAAALAFAAYELIRNDPLAGRIAIESARDKWIEVSKRLKASPP